jgi:hypothetical protein
VLTMLTDVTVSGRRRHPHGGCGGSIDPAHFKMFQWF